MTENHQKDEIVTHMDVSQYVPFIFYQSSNLRMEIQSESAMEKLHKRWMDENWAPINSLSLPALP